MLILLFLTALLNKVIICYEDSNESRYIDLLPEEEKEQFLERIARRILEDANVKNDNNNHKHSVEITDDQLNEHSEYVQKLLEEESENLRKNNADEHTKVENGESLLVKSDDKAEHYLGDVKATDLIVRKKRRDSFDTRNTGNDTYIKVDVQYDKENLDNENKDTQNPLPLIFNENNKVYVSDTEKSIDNAADKSDVEDIQVKNIRSNFPEEHIDIEHVVVTTDKYLDVTTFGDEIGENVTDIVTTKKIYVDTTDDDFKQTFRILPAEVDTENTDIFSDKTAVSSEPVKIFNDSQIDKDTKEETVVDVPTTVFTVTNLGTTKISNDKTEGDVSAVLRSSVDYKEISSNGDEPKTKQNIHDNNTINKLQLTTENLLYKDLKTPNNYTSGNIIDNISFNNTSHQIVDVTNVDSISTFVTDIINTVSVSKTTDNEKINVTSIDNGKDDIAKDFVKALRSNLLQSEIPNDNNRIETSKQIDIKQTSEFALKSKLKEYNVHEIPEDKPVFTQNSKTSKRQNEEQPYYVPIYNYSPNNAYFNAQNRYGPNFDDLRLEKDNSDNTNIGYREERYSARSLNDYNQRKFNFAKSIDRKPKSTHKHKQLHAPLHIKRLMFPSVKVVVPENHIDADYYFDTKDTPYLRNRFKDKAIVKLPASDEETHPFSNLNKVKSHIRAIRHILFEQKRFGYVNQVNSSDFKSANIDDHKEIDTTTQFPTFKLKRERTKVDNSEENSISMDYYLGHFKSDNSSDGDELVRKIGYFKDANDIQYIYLPPYTNKNNWYKIKSPNKFKNHANTDLRIKKYRSSEKVNESAFYDTFDTIIDMTDVKDLLHILEKLKALNMTKTRSYDTSNVLDAYIEVMKDMVHLNSIALKQYDWLGTTVDIQAAIKKLQDLIKSLQNSEKIHPSDLQLLKYVIYLCVESKRLLKMEEDINNSNKELRNKLFPSIKKKRKNYLKDKGLINRVWLLRREGVFDFTKRELSVLNDFLNVLHNALFDLHVAIKNIASVTNVKNQRWFEDIKELYLNNDRKQLLEIVLHLSANRLFDIIEEKSAEIETNLEMFSKENKEVIRESIEEFKFVLILLTEIITLN